MSPTTESHLFQKNRIATSALRYDIAKYTTLYNGSLIAEPLSKNEFDAQVSRVSDCIASAGMGAIVGDCMLRPEEIGREIREMALG